MASIARADSGSCRSPCRPRRCRPTRGSRSRDIGLRARKSQGSSGRFVSVLGKRPNSTPAGRRRRLCTIGSAMTMRNCAKSAIGHAATLIKSAAGRRSTRGGLSRPTSSTFRPPWCGQGLDRRRHRTTCVAAGGDGTVSTVAAEASAQAAPRRDSVGTLNHFAREPEFPSAPSAIAVIARPTRTACSMSATSTAALRQQREHWCVSAHGLGAQRARGIGLPRPVAIGLRGGRTWSGLRSIAVRLSVDGGRHGAEDALSSSSATAKYESTALDVGKRLTMTDGKLAFTWRRDSDRFDACCCRRACSAHAGTARGSRR